MRTIDGQKLKMFLISAANNLYNHYPEIDALNVFPVPDGDTGMNMNLTLSSGATEILNRNDTNIYTIAKTFSRGLLMGARGNSGVITSQIFRGFADNLQNKEEINAVELAEAFDNGRKIAYKAVIKPVEGTILTVIRESSGALLDRVNEKTSIEQALKIILDEATASLKRTPNLLPVLKEVGVVDSGGAGLVTIIDGMYLAATNKFVDKKQASSVLEKEQDLSEGYEIEFSFKVNTSKAKHLYQTSHFKSHLEQEGKILEYVENGDGTLNIKCIGINLLNVLNFCQTYGDFIDLKIHNLSKEVNEKEETKANEGGVKINIEHEEEKVNFNKKYCIIATSSGNGISELFKEVGVDFIVSGGQTMNPSTEDFIRIINSINVETCYILPNNSNIIMAANQVKEVLKDKVRVEVIPTKTILQGISSTIAFSPDLSVEDNVTNMCEAIKNVKSGAVTFAIKDTEINGVEVKKDQFMAIKETKDILSCHVNKFDALKTLMNNLVDENTCVVTILLGDDITKGEEAVLETYINENYPSIDVMIRRGEQPIYSYLIGVE